MAGHFTIPVIISIVGFGCKFLKSDKNSEITEKPKTTVIAKDAL
jgi:hypothetical protein